MPFDEKRGNEKPILDETFAHSKDERQRQEEELAGSGHPQLAWHYRRPGSLITVTIINC